MHNHRSRLNLSRLSTEGKEMTLINMKFPSERKVVPVCKVLMLLISMVLLDDLITCWNTLLFSFYHKYSQNKVKGHCLTIYDSCIHLTV